MQDAIQELISTKVDKDEYNEKMAQIDAALKKKNPSINDMNPES